MGAQDTIAKIEGLELIPRRRVTYRGAEFEEMDTDAILARKPELCAVDEFPHTNVPARRAASAGKMSCCCSKLASAC